MGFNILAHDLPLLQTVLCSKASPKPILIAGKFEKGGILFSKAVCFMKEKKV
jgi:hypothetical protein